MACVTAPFETNQHLLEVLARLKTDESTNEFLHSLHQHEWSIHPDDREKANQLLGVFEQRDPGSVYHSEGENCLDSISLRGWKQITAWRARNKGNGWVKALAEVGYVANGIFGVVEGVCCITHLMQAA